MASQMAFDIFARDHASKTFDKVGDSAERLERRFDGVGKTGGKLRGDFDGVGKSASRLGDDLDGVDGRLAGLGEHISGLGRRLGDLGDPLSSLGGRMAGLGGSALSMGASVAASAAKVGTMAAAAASAASSVGGLVVALAPAAGALAALPATLSLGAAAMGTLKFATAGLSDVFSAALTGDVEEFLEAVGPLPEAVSSFAYELRALKPDIDVLRDAVQTSLFAPLVADLETTGDLLISVVRPGMVAVAGEFGRFGAAILEAGQSVSVMRLLEDSFETLHRILSDIGSDTLRGLLADVAAFAAATLPAFDGLGGAVDRLAQRFSTFLRDAAFSGTALEWVEGAVDVFKQLGTILGDIGGIISAVFSAMQRATGDTLGVLGKLLDGLHQFLDSARGQEILVQVFTALSAAAGAFLPVIKAVASGIGDLAPVVARLAQTVGPILTKAITALGPALADVGPGIIALLRGVGQGVSAIAPILQQFAAGVSATFAKLAPLFAALGAGIAALMPGVQMFIQLFAEGLSRLAPALAPLGAALGGILAAVADLLPVIGELAALFATSLASGLQSILPSLRLLVENIGLALQNLAPIVPLFFQFAAAIINSLVPALAPLLPQIAELITRLVSGLVPALMPLIPIIGDIVAIVGQTFVGVLGVLVGKISEILPPLSEMAQLLGLALLKALQDIAPHLPALLDALLAWLPAMVDLLPSLTSLAVSLLPRFFDSLDKILPLLPDLIESMIHLNQVMYPLIPIFADLLEQMAPHIPLFIELAAVIAEQLIPPLTEFLVTVTRVVSGVLTKFTELYDKLVGHSIIPDMINKIDEWVGKLPGMFSKWVGQAKDWAIDKFNELLTWLSGLPGRIVSSLGDLGGLLVGSGRSLIQGFINGISEMIGQAVNTVTDLLNQIRARLPFSPAKEGPFSGRGWTLYSGMAMAEDLAKGLAKGENLVAKTAQSLMGAASVSLTPSSAGGQAALPLAPQGGLTLNLHFSGQPLVSRDEITRLVVAALNEARNRGFNLGFAS